MTGWHVDEETLRHYVERTDSVAEGASVEQHLLTCEQCRSRVNSAACSAAVVDLGAVWDSTLDVVQAVVLDGLTAREAAQVLDVPLSNVKTRLHRAKAQLRTVLAEGVS